ncbi:MAG: hypothetical protein RSE12_12050 [Fuscovulum sp.]|nr:hypothetical protein [Paracoccaceae bacterium]MCZ8083547.1 hypothetical protein [Paracoccaceae bacterium]WRH61122.1 MAG: hypothetical protein RSE12_12050 [Fuscovulum sp.]
MQDMAELERRIAAALHRIGEGIETLTSAASAPASAPPVEDHAADADRIQQLEQALSAERHTVAALREQLEAQAEPALDTEPAPAPDADRAELEARIEKMTAQLDVQGLEIHRMRKTVVQLRENLRGLRRAQTANLADPEQINRAMMAELEAIRVTRLSEVAEMDEILTELTPLIKEERLDA